ncbi:RES family NAD+ phosphorylase [Cupriavidus oxalaticus]|uniref:RES domain-containing protein n=1 Tax=Cupriavidus oxalaticus TaxID=96344 RepID=A0A5P3VQX5_9BURK|nr:RES domain-containing protein [Cupriavidus oxalaticus]QEZ48766.1 hypothetical protein D2917_31275 [Cupriavidus oxalaticus]
MERVDGARLPTGWDMQEDPRAARSFGERWLAACRSTVLLVPSVVARLEWNALVNNFGHASIATTSNYLHSEGMHGTKRSRSGHRIGWSSSNKESPYLWKFGSRPARSSIQPDLLPGAANASQSSHIDTIDRDLPIDYERMMTRVATRESVITAADTCRECGTSEQVDDGRTASLPRQRTTDIYLRRFDGDDELANEVQA